MRKVILLVYLAILAGFDWREKKVPLFLLVGGVVAASGMNLLAMFREPADAKWLLLTMILGMLPGISMLMAARLTGKVGYGDGLVLLIAGLITDYKTCMLLLCFSMLLMSFYSMAMLFLKRVKRETRIPYLPFLTIVYGVGMLV